MRGKGAAFLRNEFREQIGLAGRNQFLHLLLRNFSLQNHFADAERALFRRRNRALTCKRIVERINLSFPANRTKPERFMLRGIDRNRRALIAFRENRIVV